MAGGIRSNTARGSNMTPYHAILLLQSMNIFSAFFCFFFFFFFFCGRDMAKEVIWHNIG